MAKTKISEKEIREEVMKRLWEQGTLKNEKGNLAVETAIFLTFKLTCKKLYEVLK